MRGLVEATGDLGSPALLAKVDKLRELGLGNLVPLPQVRSSTLTPRKAEGGLSC